MQNITGPIHIQRVRLSDLLRRFVTAEDASLSDAEFVRQLAERFIEYRETHALIDPNE